MSGLNDEIRAALDAFDTEKARQLLRDAIKEADAETYYLASLAAIDDRQKNSFLEKALELDPFHAEAYTALHGEPEAPTEKQREELTTEQTVVEEKTPHFVTGVVMPDIQAPKMDVVRTEEVSEQPSEIQNGNYTLTLLEIGTKKINVIKKVRLVTTLGLKEAKELVEAAPQVVLTDVTGEVAKSAKNELEQAGATVELTRDSGDLASTPKTTKIIDVTMASLIDPYAVYLLPSHGSNIRTRMQSGSTVKILERDDLSEWFYIEYIGTTGQPIYGWITVHVVGNVSLSGALVLVDDLPVTKFEQNLRDDVVELIEHKRQDILRMQGALTFYKQVAQSQREKPKQPKPPIKLTEKDIYKPNMVGWFVNLATAEREVEPDKNYTDVKGFKVDNDILNTYRKQWDDYEARMVEYEKELETYESETEDWNRNRDAAAETFQDKQQTLEPRIRASEKQLARLERIQLAKRTEHDIWQEKLEQQMAAQEQLQKRSAAEQRALQQELVAEQRRLQQEQHMRELTKIGANLAGDVIKRRTKDKKSVEISYDTKKKR